MLKDEIRGRTNEATSGSIYVHTVDGTNLRGVLRAVGDDYLEIEDDQGRVAVMISQVIYAGLD
jgi:hypothetical protein